MRRDRRLLSDRRLSGRGTRRDRRNGGDRRDPYTTIFLPFEPASAGKARRMMEEALSHVDARDAVGIAQVVLSELITNGLQHGRPSSQQQIEVGWCVLEDCIRVRVGDAGAGLEQDNGSEGGLRFALVDALSRRWSIDNTAGTRITADIPL